ncbi:MAG: hypothetical protein IPO21_14060 [Bacteroidales bacterium]|nr:hypothetical protein [Bacteroidales bacterium]
MKKIVYGILLSLIGFSLFGQGGLENIIVEAIPVSAQAIAADPTLTSNHVTYRVFADMMPGYKLLNCMALGAGQELKFNTTTLFYNNAGGNYQPNNFLSLPTVNDALYFDSWLTIGTIGDPSVRAQLVPRVEDNDGVVDGYISVTNSQSLIFSGETGVAVFNNQTTGSSFSSQIISYENTSGLNGPFASNTVCLGQFTTDGYFTFDFNLALLNEATQTQTLVVATQPTNVFQVSSPLLH